MNTRRAISFVIVVGVIAMLGVMAIAQNDSQTKKNPAGSWIVTATATTPSPLPVSTHLNVTTLTEDGTVTNGLSFPASSGQGVWEKTGKREVAMTFVHLMYDATGAFNAIVKIRVAATLNEEGNEVSGLFKADAFDPSGNKFFSWEGTIQGRRITVETVD